MYSLSPRMPVLCAKILSIREMKIILKILKQFISFASFDFTNTKELILRSNDKKMKMKIKTTMKLNEFAFNELKTTFESYVFDVNLNRFYECIKEIEKFNQNKNNVFQFCVESDPMGKIRYLLFEPMINLGDKIKKPWIPLETMKLVAQESIPDKSLEPLESLELLKRTVSFCMKCRFFHNACHQLFKYSDSLKFTYNQQNLIIEADKNNQILIQEPLIDSYYYFNSVDRIIDHVMDFGFFKQLDKLLLICEDICIELTEDQMLFRYMIGSSDKVLGELTFCVKKDNQ